MPDDITTQSTTLATIPDGTKIATDLVGTAHHQRVKLDLGGDGVSVPAVAGRQADAASMPVALSSEDVAFIDGLETAIAATNTALGLLTALISGGAFKVDDDATQTLLTSIAGYVDGIEALIGTTNTNLSTIDGHVDGLETLVGATNTALAALLADATFTGRIGEVQASPTTNTVLDRLKTIGTQVTTIAGAIGSSKMAVKAGAGDMADEASMLTTLGATADAAVTAGATGSISAKLRSISRDIVANVVLAAGANLIGKVNIGAADSDPFGANADAASATGSISAKLRYLASLIPTALVGGKFSVTTATTITPTWAATTTAVLTPQMLAKGAVKQTTFSVVSAKGGYLKVKIFRSGATAIDVAIQVRLRRVTGDSPAKYGAAWFAYTCGKTTAVQGVAAGSGNNAGVASLTLNAAKTFAAGPNGDIQLGIIDDTTTPTTATEFVRQAFATSTTVKLLEFPTQSAHNSTSHVVADQAEVLEIWLDGGETYSLSIDYGSATTGDSVYIDAYFNPYNSDGAS